MSEAKQVHGERCNERVRAVAAQILERHKGAFEALANIEGHDLDFDFERDQGEHQERLPLD